MDIFLTNNLSNKKEHFVPKEKKNVGMYVCGPTVYDDPHIGNARPLVVFDILFKLLKNKFEKVSYVRNITDIDDKIIKSSEDKKISTKELTDRITSNFHDVEKLDPFHLHEYQIYHLKIFLTLLNIQGANRAYLCPR